MLSLLEHLFLDERDEVPEEYKEEKLTSKNTLPESINRRVLYRAKDLFNYLEEIVQKNNAPPKPS